MEQLLAAELPFVYNVVGRALNGHPDVDDVVQDTMLRVVRSLGELRDPGRFRSWLVAIAMHRIRDRIRERARAHETAPVPLGELETADPGGDFADLTILRLGLQGQRQEVAEATRWLDADDRQLLALWWLEVAGELTRQELADALGQSRQHTAVRVQRLKERLESARCLVRALAADACVGLVDLTSGWDGRPDSVWRKRIARHLRHCPECGEPAADVIPAQRLLAGLALVPLPAGLAVQALGSLLPGASGGGAAVQGAALAADPVGWSGQLMQVLAKPAVLATAGVTLAVGGTYVAYDHDAPRPSPPRAAPSQVPTAYRAPTGTPAPSSSPKPTRAPSRVSATARPTPARPAPARYGSVVDAADRAPDPQASPAALPHRPESGLTSSAGPKAVMEHRGDTVTLSGQGYFTVRWQLVPAERPGSLAMPTWTGLDGKLFHVASGGGRRMDDQIPGETDRPHTWMGAKDTGFTVLPAGAQQMWQNEYFYVDGKVTLHQNERGADYNLAVMPASWAEIDGEVRLPPDPAQGIVRHGLVRDRGSDRSPVPQYLTRSNPPDPAGVEQRSRVGR
ncbi:sigma-70 family RNA polymerase sigma factor [Streptomyces sp. NBC_01304]|uniref:sigma-70 family RNA polymerase sigma factor n=1 Tax=Streptomyces sp. NBC_01304 TaxID=2903818 RepID=UPI002E11A3B7|nr:sigma-70 family RNA polymerase sigma factor [Streptomyces sp. NBC_01304]